MFHPGKSENVESDLANLVTTIKKKFPTVEVSYRNCPQTKEASLVFLNGRHGITNKKIDEENKEPITLIKLSADKAIETKEAGKNHYQCNSVIKFSHDDIKSITSALNKNAYSKTR